MNVDVGPAAEVAAPASSSPVRSGTLPPTSETEAGQAATEDAQPVLPAEDEPQPPPFKKVKRNPINSIELSRRVRKTVEQMVKEWEDERSKGMEALRLKVRKMRAALAMAEERTRALEAQGSAEADARVAAAEARTAAAEARATAAEARAATAEARLEALVAEAVSDDDDDDDE
jgi:hypothetical protein